MIVDQVWLEMHPRRIELAVFGPERFQDGAVFCQPSPPSLKA
jgi:hypothetical protein